MEDVWLQAQSNIEKFLSSQTYDNWIKPITFFSLKKDSLILEVPDKLAREMILENYLPIIREAVSAVAGNPLKIEIKVGSKKIAEAAEADPPSTPAPDESSEPEEIAPSAVAVDFFTNLNRRYTFENFVCGGCNQFAHAAAQAVANKPAGTYNPLFIYGGVGLGKTHLLVAIGNHILQNNANARVSYYSSEKFMNEMINSVRYNRMEQFRSKFRSMDVLLIDDIQFIAGKERTQEEFFHTFNSLYETHKQIVVTSDKFPKDIPGLEERLRSRFEWGLIADIQPPETETKMAILKKKSEMDGIDLPDDVAEFLAKTSTSNVRELEGMLIRLGAFASLKGMKVSLSMAKEVLKDIIVDKTRDITIEMIQKHVAEHFGIKISDMKSEKRLKTVVVPRQVAIYLCRDLTKASYPEIGERFGGKDHSTIIHSVKKIDRQLSADLDLKGTIDQLRKELST